MGRTPRPPETVGNSISEILTGTAWAMASRVDTTALALVSSFVITRLYGAEAMGILALGVSGLSNAAILVPTTPCQQHVGC